MIKTDPIDLAILKMIVENLTFQEMADQLHFAARSAIFKRVNKLIRAGLVIKRKGKSRSRTLTNDGKQLLNLNTPSEN